MKIEFVRQGFIHSFGFAFCLREDWFFVIDLLFVTIYFESPKG